MFRTKTLPERMTVYSDDHIIQLASATKMQFKFEDTARPFHFKLNQNLVAFVLGILQNKNEHVLSYRNCHNVSDDVTVEARSSSPGSGMYTVTASRQWPCSEDEWKAILEELNSIRGDCFTCEMMRSASGQPEIKMKFSRLDDSCPRFRALFEARERELQKTQTKEEKERIRDQDQLIDILLNDASYVVGTWDFHYGGWEKDKPKEFDITQTRLQSLYPRHWDEFGKEDWEFWANALTERGGGIIKCRFLDNERCTGVALRNGFVETNFGFQWIPTKRTCIRCLIVE